MKVTVEKEINIDTNKFLDWYKSQLCQHDGPLIITNNTTIVCFKCNLHIGQINQTLVKRFLRDNL